MKLEDQVCSKELAQRLTELGLRKHWTFEWRSFNYVRDEWVDEVVLSDEDRGGFPSKFICPAYTVSELTHLLPWRIEIGDNKMPRFVRIGMSGAGSEWFVQYIGADSEGAIDEVSSTLANACALMLIELMEKNLLTPTVQEKNDE